MEIKLPVVLALYQGEIAAFHLRLCSYLLFLLYIKKKKAFASPAYIFRTQPCLYIRIKCDVLLTLRTEIE